MYGANGIIIKAKSKVTPPLTIKFIFISFLYWFWVPTDKTLVSKGKRILLIELGIKSNIMFHCSATS